MQAHLRFESTRGIQDGLIEKQASFVLLLKCVFCESGLFTCIKLFISSVSSSEGLELVEAKELLGFGELYGLLGLHMS